MSEFIEPGTFYLYYGPMNSGKSKELINHMNFLRFTKNINHEFFKPEIDTRDNTIKSRDLAITYKPIIIPFKEPYKILEHITDQKIIAIDEIQFFEKGIHEVVHELMKQEVQIIGAGLNLDFRGEVYKEMGQLMAIATHLRPQVAVCQYNNCNKKATRTQRLINGKPAPYDSKQDLIEGEYTKITYESRCIQDHIVPGKPTRNINKIHF